jgi:hypothetical protein
MGDFAKPQAEQSAVQVAACDVAQNGLAGNTWPWVVGFLGVLTIFLYREALRFMLWARSLNY